MGLLRTMGRTAVIAGTATAVSGGVRERQMQRAQMEQAAQQAQAQQAAQAAAPAPAAPAATDDPTIDKLQQLATLHSQGVLTDDEFAAAKAKVLGL